MSRTTILQVVTKQRIFLVLTIYNSVMPQEKYNNDSLSF
jgi:hypothetical protein